MDDLRIRAIEVKSDKKTKALKKLNKKIKSPLPKLHFNMLLLAPRNSGKTNLLLNLLINHYQKIFHRIFIFSSTYHNEPKYRSIEIKNGKVYDEGYSDASLREVEQLCLKNSAPDSKKLLHNLLIFDDVIGEIRNSSFVNSFITRSRHSLCSTIFTCQSSKGLPPKIRENCTSLIILNNLSEEMLKRYEDVLDEKVLDMLTYLKSLNVSRFNFVYHNRDENWYSYNFNNEIIP